jgi:hypothetical protein
MRHMVRVFTNTLDIPLTDNMNTGDVFIDNNGKRIIWNKRRCAWDNPQDGYSIKDDDDILVWEGGKTGMWVNKGEPCDLW